MPVDTTLADSLHRHLASREDLRKAVWNGTYRMPDIQWTHFSDQAGRVTFLGRVAEEDDGEQIVYVFTVTEFDLCGLQAAVNNAALECLVPSG